MTKDKRLIEFGWDEPDAAFMREHVEEMEATPFDGCVFHDNIGRENLRLTWECWGSRRFSEEDLMGTMEDLKATGFRRFKSNFLRFNVTPGDLD